MRWLLAGVTYLRYTVLTSSNKSERAVHCLDCNTVVFFANARDGPYSNERSGASVKTARENGERRAILLGSGHVGVSKRFFP